MPYMEHLGNYLIGLRFKKCHVVSKIIRPFGSFAPSQTYDTDQVVSNWTSSGFGSPTRLWLWAWTQKNNPKVQKEKHTNIVIQCITVSIFSRLLLQSSCTSRPISRSTRIPNCWTYQHAKRLTPNLHEHWPKLRLFHGSLRCDQTWWTCSGFF